MLVCAAFSGGAGASDAGALLEAARRGDTAQVASLLERKVEVDAPSADGSTPLLLATANDHLAVARQLIEAGADVNRQNSRLDSPYLLAGAEGRLEILRLTLLHGADLKSTNRYGGTALIPACERGHVNKLGWTGLLEAILLSDGGPRHQEIVRLLIDAGADVNLADADGVSPLAHARQRGQGGIERLLLAAGAQ